MVQPIFQKLFMLLALNQTTNDGPSASSSWDYAQNGADWGGTCESGAQQSPIYLSITKSFILPIPRIVFHHYDIALQGPLTLANNGHSVAMGIPETLNGEKPYITGGLLESRYEAEALHFHWGSPTTGGSEHVIHKRRSDLELHIVHRNVRYADVSEAVKHADGLAVLGVLFNAVDSPKTVYPGLNKILAQVSNVVEYNTESELTDSISVGQLLGDLKTNDFFTYRGSLTTPNCDQAVTWMVFPKVLALPTALVSKLWLVEDSHGKLLQNNYRVLQPRNHRAVIYRTTKDLNSLFFN